MKLASKLTANKGELKDALYLIVLQGINQLLPLFVMPYLMIVLGAERYGYVGFALSVVSYFTIVVDFGFNLSATKKIALVKDDRQELTAVFWAVVWSKTLLLLASFAVMWLLIVSVPTFRLYGDAILCTFPMVVGTAFTFLWFFQGIGKVRLMVIINTCSKMLLLPLVFVFVRRPDDYLLAAFLQALVFILTAAVSCFVLWRMHAVGRPVWRRQDIGEETRASFPLFLSTASTSVYTQLFVVILGFFCSAEAIGRYASAERIMRACCFVLYVPINQAFFPKISALSKKNRPEAFRSFAQVKLLVGGVMLLVAIALFVAAPYLPLLLGSDYAGIDCLLRIMAPAAFFIGLGGVYGQMGLIALGDGKARLHFRNNYFAAGITALVLVCLLPPFAGEYGAAIAMLLTEVTVFALMWYRTRKDLAPC